MERRQLEYLIAIVDTGSFTRAAEHLHVVQPGISAQIKALERELGEPLLHRDPRGVRPTAAGERVVARARGILGGFAAITDDVAALRGLLTGRVTLGTVRGAPLGQLAGPLGRFARDHPGVVLGLVEDETAALLDRLRDGSVDVALVGLAGDDPAGVRTQVVLEDRVRIAITADDPWSGRRRLRPADLADRGLVALPAGTGVRAAFDRTCTRAGVTPRVAFEAGALATVLELARAGLGPAVVPGTALTGLAPDLVGVDLVPATRSRLALARPERPASPAARALHATLTRDL